MEKTNRLYRSTTSRVFGGVAGGIADYFDVDPIIIRMLFLVIALAGGGGVLVYIILWIAIPPRPIMPPSFNMGGDTTTPPPPPPGSSEYSADSSKSYQAEPMPPFQFEKEKSTRGGLIGGLVLITLGSIFLADKLIPRIDFGDLWPIILVVVGAVLIITNFSEKKKQS
ncbi:MAG: PspC domain-containing protein [Bacteroidales bacterium]|nr:PspC domain-containing protein [Bacteroidales bacterium]